MKKILCTSLLALTFTGAWAQDAQSALKFSENNYFGTARSIGLGNAMTAIGGDLGSIGFNPAGSAVNKYSQFVFSLGTSTVTNKSAYMEDVENPTEYGPAVGSMNTKFIAPNFGFTMYFPNQYKRAFKGFTFGLVGNATNYFNDYMVGSGSTNRSSFAGEMRNYATAQGYSPDALTLDSNYPWDIVVGFKSGIIAPLTGSNNDYIGVTEKAFKKDNGEYEKVVAGQLSQQYARRRSGNKYDILMNFGFNFNDNLFIGANLGLTSLSSSYATSYKEASDLNDSNFDIEFENGTTRFSDFRFRQNINVEGSGIFGKFGIIYIPVKGLRLGAAIQTPTSTFVTETYQVAGDTHFSDSKYDSEAQSNLGENRYRIISPYRLNLGIAYAGTRGLISTDYEFADYSTARVRSSGLDDNAYEDINRYIMDNSGPSHILRVGGEFRVSPGFSLRGGYNFITSSERYYNADNVKVTPKAYKHIGSLGFGYKSNGSFYFDLVGRMTVLPYEYLTPYSSYTSGIGSPEYRIASNIFDVVATFGFRF